MRGQSIKDLFSGQCFGVDGTKSMSALLKKDHIILVLTTGPVVGYQRQKEPKLFHDLQSHQSDSLEE